MQIFARNRSVGGEMSCILLAFLPIKNSFELYNNNFYLKESDPIWDETCDGAIKQVDYFKCIEFILSRRNFLPILLALHLQKFDALKWP